MSFDKRQQIFTTVLTNDVLLIQEEYGVSAVAIKLVCGKGFYIGNKSLGLIVSTQIDLVVGQSVTISTEQTKYVDMLSIDCQAGGVIEVIAR